MKRYPGTVVAAAALLALILDSRAALAGAQAGIDLCIRTVIPALFPFLVLTGYLVGNLRSMIWLKPLGRLCRIPTGAEGIFLTGLVGGYPTGAAMVTEAWQDGQLPREQAQRLLGFCSNAGPAFLFGMLAPLFPNSLWLWGLWAIHILSAILTGILLPGGSSEATAPPKSVNTSLPRAMKRAVAAMGSICGWVVLFRVVIQFLSGWLGKLPNVLQVSLWGFLELTNGCVNLSAIDDPGVRFILCAMMLSFGGLCVGMQTLSVTEKLGTGLYFPGKLLQTVITGALALPVLDGRLWLLTLPLIFGIWAVFWKNSSSIFRRKPV